MLLDRSSCGQAIFPQCEPKCCAILAQACFPDGEGRRCILEEITFYGMSLDSLDDTHMAVVESPKDVRMVLEEESSHVPIATPHFTMKAQQARGRGQQGSKAQRP